MLILTPSKLRLLFGSSDVKIETFAEGDARNQSGISIQVFQQQQVQGINAYIHCFAKENIRNRLTPGVPLLELVVGDCNVPEVK